MDEIDGKPTIVQPVNSPWLDLLLQSIAQVKQRLLIVSPFIKKEAISYVEEILRKNADTRLEPLSVRVITCTRENDFLTGASDIEALQRLLEWPEIVSNSGLEMRSIENLHAKLWVVDTRACLQIITKA
jgi:hypothetical protein